MKASLAAVVLAGYGLVVALPPGQGNHNLPGSGYGICDPRYRYGCSGWPYASYTSSIPWIAHSSGAPWSSDVEPAFHKYRIHDHHNHHNHDQLCTARCDHM